MLGLESLTLPRHAGGWGSQSPLHPREEVEAQRGQGTPQGHTASDGGVGTVQTFGDSEMFSACHPESLSSLAGDLTSVWGEPAVRGASILIFSLCEQFSRTVSIPGPSQNCAVFGLSPASGAFPA